MLSARSLLLFTIYLVASADGLWSIGPTFAAETIGLSDRRVTEFDDCNAASWCPRMVGIPPGTFTMGSPTDEPGRFPDEVQHAVKIKSFSIGKFLVTRGQWLVFATATKLKVKKNCAWGRRPGASWNDPGWVQADDHPIVCISWPEASAYVRWLSKKTGHTYRLPTEAEAEYAARGGSTDAYPWGSSADHEHANYGREDCCAPAIAGRDQWEFTSPVTAFPPNGFGLYDPVGNVIQWVQDCRIENYAAAPIDGSANQTGNCNIRSSRGGCWNDGSAIIRVATRNWAPPDYAPQPLKDYRSAGVGFRVARNLE